MSRAIQLRAVLGTIDRLDDTKRLKRIIERAQKRLETLEAECEEPDEAVETRPAPRGHFSLQYIRCGKENCRCAGGELHGPYWYNCKSIGGGGYKKTYIGKNLPDC